MVRQATKRQSSSAKQDSKSQKILATARLACQLSLGSWLFMPNAVFAQRTLTVNIGTSLSFDQVVSNASNFLFYAIEFLAVALFVVGAMLMTLSRGKDDMVQKGKSLMIESMVGLAIVLAAHAILGMVLYLLYS
jgi:hypothetical protein